VHSLFFAFGSAVGAVAAWFIARRERSRLTVAAVTGVTCCLLGIVTSTIQRGTGLVPEAGLGLFGAAAPLTLCLRPTSLIGARSEIFSTVRRRAITLGVTLAYGICCASVGFMLPTVSGSL